MTPDVGSLAPTGIAIFAFRQGGVVVSEAGVPSTSIGNGFRMYAEADQNVRSGVAVQNTHDDAAHVTFELTKLDGTALGLEGSLDIPAFGQRSIFLDEIPGFETLPQPFEGILRISSPNEAGISVLGVRGTINERSDFLITTTPATDENALATKQAGFPHFVDGGGYTTRFITFSGTPGQPSSGTLQLFSQKGGVLGLSLQ